MKTATERLDRARQLIGNHDRALKAAQASVAELDAAGDVDGVARMQARAARARENLRKAREAETRYATIAGMDGYAARVGEKAAKAMPKLRADRKQVAKADRARKRSGAPAEGHEGRRKLVRRVVPSPYEPGVVESVSVNIGADVVAQLHGRRDISDADRVAADRFRALYERAEIGGVQAVDYTRTPVDGGKLATPLSVSAMEAGRELVAIRQHLGQSGYQLLVEVAVRGRQLGEIARASYGAPSKRQVLFVGGRFREVLDELARFFGVAVGVVPRAPSSRKAA